MAMSNNLKMKDWRKRFDRKEKKWRGGNYQKLQNKRPKIKE